MLFYLLCHHLLFHIFLYILLYIVLILCFNKLQALVQGHTELPGGECHRHQKRDTVDTYSSCVVGYGKQVGDARRCTGVSVQLYCTCTKVFPTQSAEADDSDVI